MVCAQSVQGNASVPSSSAAAAPEKAVRCGVLGKVTNYTCSKIVSAVSSVLNAVKAVFFYLSDSANSIYCCPTPSKLMNSNAYNWVVSTAKSFCCCPPNMFKSRVSLSQ